MGENPFYVTGNVTVTAGRKTVITNVEFFVNLCANKKYHYFIICR
jgi:hypothetical protein